MDAFLDLALICARWLGAAVAAALLFVVILVIVLVVRTLLVAPARGPLPPPTDPLGPAFQARAAEIAQRLSRAIQLQTVSYDRPQKDHDGSASQESTGDADKASADDTPRQRTGLRSRKKHSNCGALHDHMTQTSSHTADAGSDEADPFAAERAKSEAAMLQLHALLQKEYPRMHAARGPVARHVVNEFSLVYVWPGTHEDLQAVALYAHMDVVPAADAHLWRVPPFEGQIRDGYVWGRGAIDDKQAVIGICEAIEHLLQQGFTPRRTIVLMFGHDEEIGGDAGARVCALWVEAHVRVGGTTADGTPRKPLAVLLDEGLFVLDGAVPGHKDRTAMICTAEKGYVNVELTVNVVGGHASSPPKDTAIGIISRAIARLEQNPFPSRFVGPAARMFQVLLPGLSFGMRVLMANTWITRPIIEYVMAQGKSVALLRTTTAPTIVQAGQKVNTLPSSARAVINHRIHPLESVASVVQRDAAVINDPRVKLSAYGAVEPSPTSDDSAQAFAVIARAVEGLFERTAAAPALMVGATDSHWSEHIAENMYRHCPTEMHISETPMFHGVDERISVENLARICAFYTRVITEWDRAEL